MNKKHNITWCHRTVDIHAVYSQIAQYARAHSRHDGKHRSTEMLSTPITVVFGHVDESSHTRIENKSFIICSCVCQINQTKL